MAARRAFLVHYLSSETRRLGREYHPYVAAGPDMIIKSDARSKPVL
jgi:hypothetical protein